MRQPSQTLYCNNLNDQITKQDLRRHLFHLFSQYGTVIDVVALKTTRMRGVCVCGCASVCQRGTGFL